MLLFSLQIATYGHANSRYGPKMTQGQNAYRWFSSLLLYENFIQLGSNLLLLLVLGVHLEQRFGTRRIVILTVMAGVGGNFFSAAFEVGTDHAMSYRNVGMQVQVDAKFLLCRCQASSHFCSSLLNSNSEVSHW